MKTKRWAPLYKLTSAGKIQEWAISANLVENGSNSHGIYSILHGQKDGKKQYTETEIFSGKNLGKKNETSIWEQTCLEAEAIWTKKQERSGYTLYIPESKPFRPMLAKNFAEQTHNIVYPGYIQPKLNGTRCLALKRGDEIELMSRTGKIYTSMPHIENALSPIIGDCILDGELYNHNLNLQELVSYINKEEPVEGSEKVQYHIYDIVREDLDFKERHSLIKERIKHDSRFIKIVETLECKDEDHVFDLLEEHIKNGYEGVMFRNKSGKYKMNGRSADLLKCKKFKDQEFEIVDIESGRGKYKDFGIFVCKTKEGVLFRANYKGNEQSKIDILNYANNYIGKMLTVKFFDWTKKDGKDYLPQFPIAIAVRDYE